MIDFIPDYFLINNVDPSAIGDILTIRTWGTTFLRRCATYLVMLAWQMLMHYLRTCLLILKISFGYVAITTIT